MSISPDGVSFFINEPPISTSSSVILSNGTGIEITGSYPSFTITNNLPDQFVSINGGNNVTIGGTYPNFSITDNSINASNLTGYALTSNVHSVPSGGLINQVLSKNSDTDYDLKWSNVASGATWGSITGDITSQSDLKIALDAKANVSGQIFTGNIGIVSNVQTPLSNTGTINGFYQSNIQNTNVSSNASSDVVATADNGNDSIHYVDLGINCSGGGVAPFIGANEGYVYSASDNLNIAAIGSGKTVKIYAGTDTINPVGTISSTNLNIAANSASITITSPDDSNNSAEIKRVASSRALTVKNYVGQVAGGNYGVSLVNSPLQYGKATISGTTLTAVTIEGWFYPVGVGSSLMFPMVWGTGTNAWILLRWNADNTISAFANGGYNLTSTSTVTPTTWNYLALTWDGTTWTLQVNATRKTYVGGAGTLSYATVLQINGLGDGSYITNGYYDEIRLYNYAKNSTQLDASYNSGVGTYGTIPDSGLLAGWHFDDGTGTTATDYSGNVKTMTFTGGQTWVAGKVTAPSAAVQGTAITYKDGLIASERGILQLGDYSVSYGTRNVIEGLTTRFNVLGVEKGQINSSGLVMTTPITGTSLVTTGGTSSQFVKGDGTLDSSVFAKVDGTNQPFTGNLNISKIDPSFTLTSTDDSNNSAEIKRVASSRALTVKNYVGTPASNPQAFNIANNAGIYGTTPNLTAPTTGSISAWVLTNNKSATTQGIFGQNGGFGICLNWGSPQTPWLDVICIISDGVAIPVSISNSTITNGQWFHIVATYNQTVGRYKIYVNGTKLYDSTTATIYPFATTAGMIGNFHSNSIPLNGKMQQLVLWTKELSDSDATGLYNSGAGIWHTQTSLFNSGVMMGWEISEGTGTSLTDFSGNGKTATISSASWSTGLLGAPATASQGTLLNYIDGVNASEKGIAYIGDASSRTVIQGLTTRFNIGGVEKGQINSTSFNYSLPNIITGATDVPQLKVIASASQSTNDIMQVLASDATTVRFSVDAKGYLKILNSTGANTVWIAGVTSGVPSALTGNYNTVVGDNAGKAGTSGAVNSLYGYLAGATISTASYNTVFGGYSLRSSNGSFNSIFGYGAGYTSTGASNIFLGYYAGYYQTTTSNLLIIDNQNRASAALELTNSLIYGVFNATPANQTLTVNAGTFTVAYGTAQSTISYGLVINSSLNGTANGVFNVKSPNDQNLIYTNPITDRVGIGTNAPAGKLDITSTTGGLIIPRMTTTQKNALTPVNGMLVYDSTLDKFQGYQSGSWQNLI